MTAILALRHLVKSWLDGQPLASSHVHDDLIASDTEHLQSGVVKSSCCSRKAIAHRECATTAKLNGIV